MATSHNTHKKEKTRSVGEDVEKSEPWCVAGGNKKMKDQKKKKEKKMMDISAKGQEAGS